VIALRERILQGPPDKIYDVDLAYITARGHWYQISWKGDVSKSGGIATNIGVHFYDMLQWIFGAPQRNVVHVHTHDRAAGYLEFARARVRWFLSIDGQTLPAAVQAKGGRTYRSLTIEGEEFEFSEGFADLHTLSYQDVLAGGGFGLEAARPAIELVHTIRNAQPVGRVGEYHPLLQ
jgi:UDP-N-acetyl-2-amino-2-deoxyglucuronate dehydrogenase